MSRIHLNRNRQNLGQFSPEEVAVGLRSGRFYPTDLAWREGMETWQPLETFTDLPEPPLEESAPTPILAPGSELRDLPTAPASGHRPAWERREELGMVTAAVATVREVLTDPINTFRDLARTGGFLWPLVFSYVLQTVCGLVSILIALVWVRVLPPHLLTHMGENPVAEFTQSAVFSLPVMLAAGLITPFLVSGLYFLVIKLISKKTVAYETVFRAYCYVTGSLAVLNLIPIPPIPAIQFTFVGLIVIAMMIYQVIAVREAVGLSNLEAITTVLLPLALCCVCVFTLAFGAVAAMGAASGLPGATP